MDLYFERHDGEAATVEDFVACFAEASGRDLKPVLPLVRAGRHAGGDAPTATTTPTAARFALDSVADAAADARPAGEAAAAHPAGDRPRRDRRARTCRSTWRGAAASTRRDRTHRAEADFRFRGLKTRPVLSLNRGFSAPVKLATNLGPDDLYFLMGRDGDAFNRWEAGQTAARQIMLDAVEAIGAGKPPPPLPTAYVGALERSLADPVARSGLPRADADAARRRRHRRRSSAATSIPTPSTRARRWLKAATGGALAGPLAAGLGDAEACRAVCALAARLRHPRAAPRGAGAHRRRRSRAKAWRSPPAISPPPPT